MDNAKIPTLHIEHLQKKFGKFEALKDITFDIYPGEVFGFIGPNGAGKSTTIRTLLGILRASGGKATIFEQDMYSKMPLPFTVDLPMFLAMFIFGLISVVVKLSIFF
ncbi:hypothetical protein LBO01_25310 [Companilactobacillus paralimentarius]|nr:Sulfate/thiosulfate import ATP-binding protein CysA [Companilactobacillus bobalius]GEO59402.1 hypothetical protein LBO01_25310 [Companilactobacillus paralimentarius]